MLGKHQDLENWTRPWPVSQQLERIPKRRINCKLGQKCFQGSPSKAWLEPVGTIAFLFKKKEEDRYLWFSHEERE